MEAQRQFAVNQAVKYIKAFYGSWAYWHSTSHPSPTLPPECYGIFCYEKANSQSVFWLKFSLSESASSGYCARFYSALWN